MESARLTAKLLALSQSYDRLNNIRGNPQTIRIQRSQILRRIRFIKSEISRDLHLPIISAKYKVDDVTYECLLTNISILDFKELLGEVARLSGNKIEFLEIKEIPTYIRKVQL